ncbi:MAG: pilus assembly PilX N-terminal domain-containing protein [Candidatus Gracilibacteria bacterium]|jgi:hypothetical protein
MKKFLNKIRTEKNGNALIIALLIMGILMTISMAISSLIFREIRITKDMISAGKAYYLAESGVEEALYKLENNLDGWQMKEPLIVKPSENSDSNYEYFIKNTCNSYPCVDSEDFDVQSAASDASAYYGVLNLNENLTLPLFIFDEVENKIKSVKNFTVEFFGGFNPATDLKISNLSGWDVLRWKVFGLKSVQRDNITETITESISDFTAIATVLNAISENNPFTNAVNPSWFGSVSCTDHADRVNPDILCQPYQSDVSKSSDDVFCNNTEARDHYVYINGEVVAVSSCYPIESFLSDHQPEVSGSNGLNYLSLTNMMNPAVFKDTFTNEDKARMSKIYFRIETYDDKIPREYADITSSGYVDGKKQTLNVKKKRGQYMPVFNFSIYSTYGSKGYYLLEGQ